MLLVARSRRIVTASSAVFSLSRANHAGASRNLSAAVSGDASSRKFDEKPSAPSILSSAAAVSRETPGSLGWGSKRSLYSSASVLGGTRAGWGSSSCGRDQSACLRGPTPTASNIKCEATVAAVEAAPVEKFEYQAEVSRLLDLIVHSLYSNKEVFLRELVSNSSDALDKLRFLSVTEPDLMSGNPNLEIRLQTCPEDGTITITDTGVGMSREELVKSLGTIAESGTAKFLKALKENQNNASENNLIGQFGVGFYSAFLVANKVSFSTRKAGSDRQYVWEGEADTSVFTIREETDPQNFVPRGTRITLYLKSDAKDEYTDPVRIQNLVKNYSQFISFPIYTYQEKTITNEVDDVEADKTEVEDSTEVTEKKKKKVSEKRWEWELTNETKPIWLRAPKDITSAEYNEFFKNTFKEFMDPMAWTHFGTEGEVEFKSLLYVPGIPPLNSDDIYSQRSKNIKLYMKRVFISDNFEGELLPRYLGFIKGVVDSNDLPLNVSREILQESRIMHIMKKRLIKKTFDMIDGIAERENKNDYKIFWTSFAKNIKMGCIDDSSNHKRLGPLLRFISSKTAKDDFTSLDEYVERMKPDQKNIFYLAADTVKSAKDAPFLEEMYKRDLEVLFLVDPVDEVAITNLAIFKDKKFVDVTKEDLDLESDDKEKDKEVEINFKPFCDWVKKILGEKVSKVKISNRISSSPCVLVAGKHGWSANMERIMKAQTLGVTPEIDEYMRGRRVFEINPKHSIIQELDCIFKENPKDFDGKQMVLLLFENAQLASGFTPENPSQFCTRVYDLMATALGSGGDREAPVAGAHPDATPAEFVDSESKDGFGSMEEFGDVDESETLGGEYDDFDMPPGCGSIDDFETPDGPSDEFGAKEDFETSSEMKSSVGDRTVIGGETVVEKKTIDGQVTTEK